MGPTFAAAQLRWAGGDREGRGVTQMRDAEFGVRKGKAGEAIQCHGTSPGSRGASHHRGWEESKDTRPSFRTSLYLD